ncbi:hypothetical protein BH10ACT2_BH10ACT2_22170 [soil metagenome]
MKSTGNPIPSSSVPSDNTTLVAIIQGYRESGFDSDFSSLDGARIRCESCGAETDAAKFVIESLRRLEGASDPDDMLAVVATKCPACGAEGTLILGYGPMASGEDTDIASAMKDGRDQSPLPPNASPADENPVAS